MFFDEYAASAAAAKAKVSMLGNNPLGYFAASALAGAYIGFGILLIFTINSKEILKKPQCVYAAFLVFF